MESYEEFKKKADYGYSQQGGYQPQYTQYDVNQNHAFASNVPQGQKNWNVTRNASGQVTSFSNQAGLQRQQRMQQMRQNNQYGNITPQQYQQMVAMRQYRMNQAAYQWKLQQAQQQRMAMQQRMMAQQNYGQMPQMAAPPPPQPQYQQNQHGSVTSIIGKDAQGRRTFSAHN